VMHVSIQLKIKQHTSDMHDHALTTDFIARFVKAVHLAFTP